MRKTIATGTFVLLALGMTNAAAAYVGPGAGLSLLGALWGLLLAVLAALGFLIFWPLRRLLKRARGKGAATAAASQSQTTEAAQEGASGSRST